MRAYLFASVTIVSASLLMLAACGGGAAPGPGAKPVEGANPTETPAADGTPSSSSGAASGSSAGAGAGAAAATADAGPTSTTTTTLGTNADLGGAKLQSSSTMAVEIKGDGGAKPDPHSAEPGRRREDIQALIVAHRDEARKCYDDAFKTHPGIEGDIDIKWTINPKGAITDIMVDDTKSTIHEASVGTCIIAIIKTIKFAESPKGFETKTHYPYNFHPHGTQSNAVPKK
jgi:hypothetical protein